MAYFVNHVSPPKISNIFLSHVIKYTICLFAPFQLVFPKSVPGMCPTSQRWEFSKILRTLPLMDIIGSYAMVSLRIC